MKVLMFGWEFPPHISGGLGTACFGLTQSLIEQNVKVLFVVPRLCDEQLKSHDFLINASEVIASKRFARRSRRGNVLQKDISSSLTGSDLRGSRGSRQAKKALTYVEIPSTLKPYHHAQGDTRQPTTLTEWNHPISTRELLENISLYERSLEPVLTATAQTAEETLAFSGTYGNNLMEEVRRYADVASVIANEHSFDAIHAHDWMTFPAGIAVKQKTGKPLIIHIHSTEFDRAGDCINEDVYRIELQGMRAADRIITVSNWTKEMVMSRYYIPEKKIKVIYNGIRPKQPPAEFAFPDIGSHFVTFLGRITRQKGPGYFVEAAAKVLEEFPRAHFIVAGAGDLLPQIIERVAQLNMSANFHFTGFLSGPQVDQIWTLTDVYVMPSVSEPFGIAPLEAIQGGVPVILSKQSGVSEVMPHAIKVDFWNVTALAAAICSVLRYESLSQVLQKNSKAYIRHLTWDKAARDVKALYHELECKK